jgi:hypothetical protein
MAGLHLHGNGLPTLPPWWVPARCLACWGPGTGLSGGRRCSRPQGNSLGPQTGAEGRKQFPEQVGHWKLVQLDHFFYENSTIMRPSLVAFADRLQLPSPKTQARGLGLSLGMAAGHFTDGHHGP